MKIIARLFTFIVFLLPAVLLAGQCPGTDPDATEISDPEVFKWTHVTSGSEEHWTGTMEIAEASLMVNGESITTRVYRQEGSCDSIPGPTMNMVPGRKYVLRFRNELPYEDKLMEHNVFKDPNISNLHTHGLHISGESPGDDVTRSFEGGFGGDFVYDILPDHMGGTYWYHAHHHGSTYLQVSGGAFGLIVIDDSGDDIPPEVAQMEERQLVIAYLDPDVRGTGGDTLIQGSLSPTWTVNGHVNGDLIMPSNTWQHFRILLADRDAKPKTVSIGSQCDVQLLARDGVWRTVAPLDLADNSIKITGASRADLAVNCGSDSSISVGGTQVASIVIDGTTDTGPSPGSNWSAKRPVYLRDLREQTVDNTESVNMGARTINGSKYDGEVPTFALTADGLQRWSLKGARNHPFHLHIYHVQIDGSCADYEDGEYYDVVANNCTILFDLDENEPDSSVYAGRTIMHCHILEHEDQGAMGWVNVIGGHLPPTYPVGFGYEAYFGDPPTGGTPPAAPSGLTATTISTSQIDLAWTDNSSNEDSFEIEISGDNSNFINIDSVGTDVISYSDTALQADTTWYYRIQAKNLDGVSAYSNSDSATTHPSGGATNVQVGSITVSTVGVGQGWKTGRADVVITDNLGGLVESATVYGEFTGDMGTEELSSDTDPDGSVIFETNEGDRVKGKVSLTFCVSSISSNDSELADYTGDSVCNSL